METEQKVIVDRPTVNPNETFSQIIGQLPQIQVISKFLNIISLDKLMAMTMVLFNN